VVELIKPVKIKRIGVALEHVKSDFEILSMALTVAKHHKASLTLLHVVNTPGTIIYGKDSRSRQADVLRAINR
jgi:hypothetical protein